MKECDRCHKKTKILHALPYVYNIFKQEICRECSDEFHNDIEEFTVHFLSFFEEKLE